MEGNEIMKKRIAVVLLGLTLLLTGCNEAARSFGGTMTLKLEKNQKTRNDYLERRLFVVFSKAYER